jgi:hypothetical protein
MLFTAFKALLTLLIVYAGRQVYALLQNLKICRDHGIPAIINPHTPNTLNGAVLGPFVHKLLIRLPPWLQPPWTDFLRMGWPFVHDYEKWQHLGPVWALVTTKEIRISVADPGACLEVLERRDRNSDGNGFQRPPENYGLHFHANERFY